MTRRLGAAVAVAAVLGVGCGEGGPNFDLADNREPVRIVISPTSCESVAVGRTCRLEITAYDRNNNPTFLPHLFWSARNTGVATVNLQGEVTGVSPGSTMIRADTQDPEVFAEFKVRVVARS